MLAAALWGRPPVCCWFIPPIFLRSSSSSIIVPAPITELYDGQGRIIGSFALQRRVVATYDDFPPGLRDALISIEDKDFYRTGASMSGGSPARRTATSNPAAKCRAHRLSPCNLRATCSFRLTARSIARLQEALLAIQIERRFTKPQIFTLYANQIFLGHGVYGFEAASEYYFSKPAKQLTLDEAALLAGLAQGAAISIRRSIILTAHSSAAIW